MDLNPLQYLCELFPGWDPEFLEKTYIAHGGNFELTLETLLEQSLPAEGPTLEVMRPPGDYPQPEPPGHNPEVDAFKRELGQMLRGDAPAITSSTPPLKERIKAKLKKWFSRKPKGKQSEEDPASTLSPSEPDEEVITFYAPEGLRKGERNDG